MAATAGYRDTQRAGLAVLFAIRKCADIFDKPAQLRDEVTTGVGKLSNVVDTVDRRSAEAAGEKAGELVHTWHKSKRPAISFLEWIQEVS